MVEEEGRTKGRRSRTGAKACNCNVGLGVVSDCIRCSPSHQYNFDLTAHGLNAPAREEMLCRFDGTRRHRMRLKTGRGTRRGTLTADVAVIRL